MITSKYSKSNLVMFSLILIILTVIFSYGVDSASAANTNTSTINITEISVNNSLNNTPNVTFIDPANNALKVPANQVIKVTFNEPIKSGTMWIELKNSSKTLIPIKTSISGNVLTINHSTLLTNGKYALTLHTDSVTNLAGNPLTLWGSTFSVYSTPPTASASPKGGTYKDIQIVVLSMSKAGNIYYTTHGNTPTTSGSQYTSPISIAKTTVLKYFAVDLAGNKSPVYTQTYTLKSTSYMTDSKTLTSYGSEGFKEVDSSQVVQYSNYHILFEYTVIVTAPGFQTQKFYLYRDYQKTSSDEITQHDYSTEYVPYEVKYSAKNVIIKTTESPYTLFLNKGVIVHLLAAH